MRRWPSTRPRTAFKREKVRTIHSLMLAAHYALCDSNTEVAERFFQSAKGVARELPPGCKKRERRFRRSFRLMIERLRSEGSVA
jgi:hypothetical protein